MSVTTFYTSDLTSSSPLLKTASAPGSTNTKKSPTDNSLTANDFLKLFIKQLQNQDATNPMDSSEMMSQITQLSNMQMMQNMANFSKSSFAVSLIGKYVTAKSTDSFGNITTITGKIDRVVSKNGDYTFFIGDKSFSSDKITEISETPMETQAPESGSET
ncbi:MAG: flagellar hook assembly protein FlgD [Oscillospiraceae bacterium]|jgi:flagellar basal-body rod modification protein FlgD